MKKLSAAHILKISGEKENVRTIEQISSRPNKQIIPIRKLLTYGEVLTTAEEVKEAQEKILKTPTKKKRKFCLF